MTERLVDLETALLEIVELNQLFLKEQAQQGRSLISSDTVSDHLLDVHQIARKALTGSGPVEPVEPVETPEKAVQSV